MLLQKLAQYFERLEDQAPAMYVKTRIRSLIELDSEGRFHGLVATEGGMKGKKDRGKRFFAPHLGRSSAIQAKLLADNAEYVLGLARDSEKQKRVDECHQAFVEEVRKCADFTGEPAVQAVLKFLDEWQPGSIPLSEEFDPSDVVTFRVDGVLPIELASVKKYWASYATPGGDAGLPSAKTEGELMQCLICGRLRPAVSRLPFKIKGVPGGQTSGMALISANSPAFESYGLEASLIAPTCQECGERFSKAANALIEGESTHIRIPPLVYIFWTREESDFNPARLLSTPEPDEVKALIGSAFTGAKSALRVDGAHFYATALSASGARVAVRDWIDTTVEEAKRNLAHYFALQRIVEWNGAEGKPLGLYALAASTVRDANTELPAHVPQSLLRMALRGGQLPLGLLFQAVKRNRAEQAVTRPRAALVKMVLLSQEPKLSLEDTMTQLDPGNRDAAYLCGRLMGILESVQRAALGDVGANVTSRFFGTASSAPASVFGNLLRGAQPHLQKLKKERRATYEALERRLEEVMASLPGFPRVLTLEEQGLFSLGYFRQRAADRAAAIAHKKSKEPGDQGQDNADQQGGKSDE